MAFLEIRDACKGYPTQNGYTHVLKNINLDIEEGDFVAIVGYSGAGKTTLISLLAGLIKPDSGTLTLNGLPITEPGPDRGVVVQNHSLLPSLTVYENIHLAVAQIFPDWSEELKTEQVNKYVAMVNLTRARDKRPKELSGGMRQRVSVARALAIEPQVLLLDEPLSALDALTRATLQDEISRIWQEQQRTVILITNDVDEGVLLADYIIPLSSGPEATLGPRIPVDLPRPRDRKAIHHDPSFKRTRKEVIDYLLGDGAKKESTVTRELILPRIEPEDPSPPCQSFPPGPIQESEVKSVEVPT
jgi:nitrate/nitrite transport system ATP-binding protein